ncbi:MAG: tRNA pseudouridine(55) synthase TruB [Clostridia bacterium]|nr:tRNA pseudouridine(55) synthase TruB [Clostridia bacterium]
MNGVINVKKGAGMTSHDVVYRLRKLLAIKKIGHTGTLDPDAEGVLPMCVGRATKVADMLTAQDKQYIAEVTLGSATDTLDASGEVTEVAEVNVSIDDIREAVSLFVGEIEQIPPMYSAIKVDGKKLYELAREGVEIERKPRKVKIEKIEILDIDLENKKFSMRVDCTKGTYIRTLCDDIGRRLGTFAHMSALTRTRSGRFDISEALSLEEIEEMLSRGDLSFFTPIDEVFEEYPRLVLSKRRAALMCNGVKVSVQGVEEGQVYRVYDESGNFLTISEAEGGVLKILKTFYQTIESGGGNDANISS